MCVIIYDSQGGLLDETAIRNFYRRNEDGVGLMFPNGQGKVSVHKIGNPRDADEVVTLWAPHKDQPYAMHMRLRTHGDINEFNCHPYPVLSLEEHGRDLWMMHNGILTDAEIIDKDKSDTWHFIEHFLRPALAANPDLLDSDLWRKTLGNLISSNKLLFMDGLGTVTIINRTKGVERDEGKVWMSNTIGLTDSWSRTGTGGNARGGTYYGGYGGEWGDDGGYGQGNYLRSPSTSYKPAAAGGQGKGAVVPFVPPSTNANNGTSGSASKSAKTESKNQVPIKTALIYHPIYEDRDYQITAAYGAKDQPPQWVQCHHKRTARNDYWTQPGHITDSVRLILGHAGVTPDDVFAHLVEEDGKELVLLDVSEYLVTRKGDDYTVFNRINGITSHYTPVSLPVWIKNRIERTIREDSAVLTETRDTVTGHPYEDEEETAAAADPFCGVGDGDECGGAESGGTLADEEARLNQWFQDRMAEDDGMPPLPEQESAARPAEEDEEEEEEAYFDLTDDDLLHVEYDEMVQLIEEDPHGFARYIYKKLYGDEFDLDETYSVAN